MTIFLIGFPKDVPAIYLTDGRACRISAESETEVVSDNQPKVFFHPYFPGMALFSAGSAPIGVELFNYLNAIRAAAHRYRAPSLHMRGNERLQWFDPNRGQLAIEEMTKNLKELDAVLEAKGMGGVSGEAYLLSISGRDAALARVTVIKSEYLASPVEAGRAISPYHYLGIQNTFEFPIVTGGSARLVNDHLLELRLRGNLPTKSDDMLALLMRLADLAASDFPGIGGTFFFGTLFENSFVDARGQLTDGPFAVTDRDRREFAARGEDMMARIMSGTIGLTNGSLRSIAESLADPDVLRRGYERRVRSTTSDDSHNPQSLSCALELLRSYVHAIEHFANPYVRATMDIELEPFLCPPSMWANAETALRSETGQYADTFIARTKVCIGATEERTSLILSALPILRRDVARTLGDAVRHGEIRVAHSWLGKALVHVGQHEEAKFHLLEAISPPKHRRVSRAQAFATLRGLKYLAHSDEGYIGPLFDFLNGARPRFDLDIEELNRL